MKFLTALEMGWNCLEESEYFAEEISFMAAIFDESLKGPLPLNLMGEQFLILASQIFNVPTYRM